MNQKKIVAFGDSFTWGSDLLDYTTHTPSLNTWPALLAKEFNLEYTCFAVEGGSNQTILRLLLENIDNLSDCLVILNWTWIDRWDFYDINSEHWNTLRPTGTESSTFAHMYYKYFQSELWDKLESLKSINLALSLLEQKNIPYITTCIDSLAVDTKFHNPSYINFLINNVCDKLLWFNGAGFYHWSKENNYSISNTWHPLEEAHQAAFEYVKNNYEFT